MKKLKVIYVDDDAININLMADLSNEFEWNFKGYTDSVEAISILNSEYFDVIFSDLQMPCVNGLELIDSIRNDRNNPNLKTPIYIITGNPDGNEAEKCLKQDISGIIPKPFSIDVLHDISKKLLDKKTL